MFRQIRIHPDDSDLQRILWRTDPREDIRDFRLLTVTYGTTSASYLALRTLLQLADDEEHRYPLGSRTVRENAYVDDILSGGDTIQEALAVKTQTEALLIAGGFELSK